MQMKRIFFFLFIFQVLFLILGSVMKIKIIQPPKMRKRKGIFYLLAFDTLGNFTQSLQFKP